MPLSAITKPETDPTRIFERFRDFYSTELLAVSSVDFKGPFPEKTGAGQRTTSLVARASAAGASFAA